MRHFNITFEPDGKRISIHAGATLLEAAQQAGIIINTVCGGKGTCRKCAVEISPDKQEVLACQHQIDCDLVVTIPESARFFEQKILDHGLSPTVDVHPTVRKQCVSLDTSGSKRLEGVLNEARPISVHRLTNRLKMELAQISYADVGRPMTFVCHHEPSQLGTCGRSGAEKCTYHVVAYEPGDTTKQLYGVAVDIGTTTVVARLFDLTNGKVMATASDMNPQAQYGDDVISRISYVESEEKLNELHRIIIKCLNTLLGRLARKAGVRKDTIYELTIVGNTTMNHLFLKLPVEQLGQAPYLAHSLEAYDVAAARMKIRVNPAANIHTVENIAGFVGADTSAAALACAMDRAEELTLLVDIGTNGEIVLGTKEKLYAASCAAGPALEGARISQGSRAVAGAIEGVVVNDRDIDVDVIGDKAASSICGSGLIDAVAVMLDLSVIDNTGRFVENRDSMAEAIRKRICTVDSQLAFVLAWTRDKRAAVTLTQRDIREVQLAKAAMRTGIKLLQMKLNLCDEDLVHILLAGAFGNYIRKSSALRIGLLPEVSPERIHFVGNAAGTGAQMVLLNRKARALVGELARSIEYVEIAHDPAFSAVYADSMLF